MWLKLEWLSRRTFPLVLLFALAGAAMLYLGASDGAMRLFVAAFFVVAAPMLLVALAAPIALWRDRRRPPRDIPEEWR